jgi:hypothetical protein
MGRCTLNESGYVGTTRFAKPDSSGTRPAMTFNFFESDNRNPLRLCDSAVNTTLDNMLNPIRNGDMLAP